MARERATRTAFEARFGPIAGSAQAPPADEAPGNGDGDGGDGGLREPGGEDGAGEAGVPDALAEDGDDAVGELRRAIAMSMGEDEDAATPEGDGAGGAPDAPPSANANANANANAAPLPGDANAASASASVSLPAPADLLATVLRLSERNEAMAHAGAKLLTQELRRVDDAKKRATVRALAGAVAAQAAQLAEGDAAASHARRLRAATHLLTLVFVQSPETRAEAAEAGVAATVLNALEYFLDLSLIHI